VLWPDHCVQGTDGAAIHKGIDIPHAQLVIRKGFNPKVDSYSAFIEADGKIKTGLDGYLRGRNIRSVYVVGLATDFCVAWTAMDARKLGLAATVIEDACRGIDANGSLAKAWASMAKAGVRRVQSTLIAS
jgi:nicotinamidase/pyrazinamidase